MGHVRGFRRATGIISCGLISVVAFSACQRDAATPSPRPAGTVEDLLTLRDRDDLNVLFILVDTLRADHLSVYGYERDTSPVIDQLAREGIRFPRHVSQSSWTKCSMASMWTGLYPPRSRVTRAPDALPGQAVLPAEIFREAGFRTSGIWRNGWIAPNFGFGQGFETYTQPKPGAVDRPQPHKAPHMTLPGTDADIIRSAITFLRSYGHERWFLYLHMMDVHQYVYSPEEALYGTSYLDIYDNSIRWTDGLIGHLLDELEERGLRDNTLIVFASDHGEAFGDHGSEGHARDVYAEVTTTPFILSLPFRLDPGIVVDSRTANVDLWPTVLELVGMSPLEETDGRTRVADILAAGRGTSAPTPDGPESTFAMLDQSWGRDQQPPLPLIAVHREDWRLIHSAARPAQPELFDKRTDPAEQNNVAGENPEVVESLKAVVEKHLDAPPPPWGDASETIELDDMQMNQLRALGYGVQ
jgi:arylsulfatase A-like enzyme